MIIIGNLICRQYTHETTQLITGFDK